MAFLFEMTFDPTVVTSPHLLWSSLKLWARDLFIEYFHLFCQILYNFCQRFFTCTCALPSDRLEVRALSRSLLYCFDKFALPLLWHFFYPVSRICHIQKSVHVGIVVLYLLPFLLWAGHPQKLIIQLLCPVSPHKTSKLLAFWHIFLAKS